MKAIPDFESSRRADAISGLLPAVRDAIFRLALVQLGGHFATVSFSWGPCGARLFKWRGTYPRPRVEPEAAGAGVEGISPRTVKTRDVTYPFEMCRKSAHLEGISDIPCLSGDLSPRLRLRQPHDGRLAREGTRDSFMCSAVFDVRTQHFRNLIVKCLPAYTMVIPSQALHGDSHTGMGGGTGRADVPSRSIAPTCTF
jgi:hypothetical protein